MKLVTHGLGNFSHEQLLLLELVVTNTLTVFLLSYFTSYKQLIYYYIT